MGKSKRDLTREITNRHDRYIWERHASSAYLVDLMMLQGDSTTLAAAGALVLAYPRFAKKARFKRSVPDAAERLFAYLEEQGWDVGEIMEAGSHAFQWLAGQLPPTSGSDEVKEATDFSEAGPEDTPGE